MICISPGPSFVVRPLLIGVVLLQPGPIVAELSECVPPTRVRATSARQHSPSPIAYPAPFRSSAAPARRHIRDEWQELYGGSSLMLRVFRIRMDVGASGNDYPRTCGIWVKDTTGNVTF